MMKKTYQFYGLIEHNLEKDDDSVILDSFAFTSSACDTTTAVTNYCSGECSTTLCTVTSDCGTSACSSGCTTSCT